LYFFAESASMSSEAVPIVIDDTHSITPDPSILSPEYSPCWLHLRNLGFVQFQGEPANELDVMMLEHECTDGFINHFFDNYEDRHGSVPDMLPETISTCLGIVAPVAEKIAARWQANFEGAPVLFYGEMDYIRFIRDYFLQQEPHSAPPLPESIIQHSASGTVQPITIDNQVQNVFSLHVPSEARYWQQLFQQLGPFRPLVEWLDAQFPDDQFLRLYHGTTQSSAGSILTDGVLCSAGEQRQDFSNLKRRGYYCSFELSQASIWAYRRAANSHEGPAVIIHAIPLERLGNLNQKIFESACTQWQALVMNSRTQNRYPSGFRMDYDVIRGPICGNPFMLRRGEAPSAGTMGMQWCALSDRCASLLTSSIVAIVFVCP
jgi:hypothetical protein